MNIIKNIEVPTGNICISEGEKGLLEFLSLGDYGKEKNLKADFLGLTKEINGVPHGDLIPLSKKWVITISSQYGCSMNCSFCDVPLVGKGTNVSFSDLNNQVFSAIRLHPEIEYTDRINLHYARMGEPTWNHEVISSAYHLYGMFSERLWGFHPVVSTMMPRNNRNLMNFLDKWIDLKDYFNGEAGLQVSINTTDEEKRQVQMPMSMSLKKISEMFFDILSTREKPKGRKITLNFALTNDEINATELRDLFSPKYFICKITPIHETKSCVKNLISTSNGYDYFYPYKKVEESLKDQGFDVIVFVPSKEEDESKITCGNAILSELI